MLFCPDHPLPFIGKRVIRFFLLRPNKGAWPMSLRQARR